VPGVLIFVLIGVLLERQEFEVVWNNKFYLFLKLAKILIEMKEIHIFNFIESLASSGVIPSSLHGIESLNCKNFSYFTEKKTIALYKWKKQFN